MHGLAKEGRAWERDENILGLCVCVCVACLGVVLGMRGRRRARDGTGRQNLGLTLLSLGFVASHPWLRL
jgi:hypothetical protein